MAPLTATAYRTAFEALDVASDGFVSVDLHDGRYIWLLADNLVPHDVPYPTADLRSNAYVIQDGDTFTMTRVPAPFNTGTPRAYWPLCGWASDNVLHVLCDGHINPAGTFDGMTLESFYLPSMTMIDFRDFVPVPPMPGSEGAIRAIWAAGLYDDGTDIWIYGVVSQTAGGEAGMKQHHVARCPRNCIADTFKWEYEGMIPHTTSAASIGPYDSGKIIARGPLGETERWTASDPTFADIQVDYIEDETPGLPTPGIAFPWAYAAHCHPHLPALASGKMLLTVNVNDGPNVPADDPDAQYFPDFYEIDP